MEIKEKRVSALEKSGRITPREVLEAYEETGFEPMFEGWFEWSKHGSRACGITVLAVANGVEPARLFEFACGVDDYMEKRIEYVGDYYQSGFTVGFDGGPCPEPSGDDHPLVEGSEGWIRMGWRDGKRARTFVKARFGNRSSRRLGREG